jgi:hypothetical protein
MSTQFVEVFGFESPNFESFIDLVFENNKTFSRFYLRKENVSTEERNKIIRLLTINYEFIIDKELKDRLELIDYRTGKMRFYIWKNGLIEYYSKELL